ncbi:hypothetical protein [Endozoicomonas arenosclerae]|uniref:hypothetical protein n=1 Tax=Endozoicomonas arenosclerae TaxID=1633495 RepID=UPI0012946B51|nr:hypothetical protein [Endozoicomonas arenosclerae]
MAVQEEAGQLLGLPEGVYEISQNGSTWWEGACPEAIVHYYSSPVSTWFRSVSSLLPMVMTLNLLFRYSPKTVSMLSMFLTGMGLVDFAFLFGNGLALFLATSQRQPKILTLPFHDRIRAPLLIQLTLPANASVPGYRIQSLWQPEYADEAFGDDEYLQLAKIMSERKVSLNLRVTERDSAQASTLRERLILNRYLFMGVYQYHQYQKGYKTSVVFEDSSSLQWVEPELFKLDVAAKDLPYQSAIAPAWIKQMSQWLLQHPDMSSLDGVVAVEPGVMSNDVWEDEMDLYHYLSEGPEGCFILDMYSAQWFLPALSGWPEAGAPCFSLGRNKERSVFAGQACGEK